MFCIQRQPMLIRQRNCCGCRPRISVVSWNRCRCHHLVGERCWKRRWNYRTNTSFFFVLTVFGEPQHPAQYAIRSGTCSKSSFCTYYMWVLVRSWGGCIVCANMCANVWMVNGDTSLYELWSNHTAIWDSVKIYYCLMNGTEHVCAFRARALHSHSCIRAA